MTINGKGKPEVFPRRDPARRSAHCATIPVGTAALAFALAALPAPALAAPYLFRRTQTLTSGSGDQRVFLGQWYSPSSGPDIFSCYGASVAQTFQNQGTSFNATAATPTSPGGTFSCAAGTTGASATVLAAFYGSNAGGGEVVTFGPSPGVSSGFNSDPLTDNLSDAANARFAHVLGGVTYDILVSDDTTPSLLFRQIKSNSLGTMVASDFGLQFSGGSAFTPRMFRPALIHGGPSVDFVALSSTATDTNAYVFKANTANDTVSAFSGGFGYSKAVAIPFAAQVNAAADCYVGSTGLDDVVAALQDGTLASAIQSTTTPGTFAAPTTVTGVSTTGVTGMVPVDLNGDGKTDGVVLLNSGSSPAHADLVEFPGGTASVVTLTPPAAGYFPTDVASADVDGDGQKDLVVSWMNSSNAVQITVEHTDVAPTASITSPTNGTVILDHSNENINASATVDRLGTLSWDFSVNGSLITHLAGGATSPQTFVYPVPGTCSADLDQLPVITVKVTDDLGLTATAQETLDINPQTDTATLTSVGNVSLPEQTAWTGWSGLAESADCSDSARAITYTATVDGTPSSRNATEIPDGSGTPAPIGSIPADNVCVTSIVHNVTAQASIAGTGSTPVTGSTPFTVTHVEGLTIPPSSISAAPTMVSSVQEQSSITLQAVATDECPARVTLTWSDPITSTSGIANGTAITSPTWCAARTGWTLTATATDADYVSGVLTPEAFTAGVPVTVTQSPTAKVAVAPGASAPSVNAGGAAVTISANATPYCAGDALGYSWTVPSGVPAPGPVASFAFTPPAFVCNGGSPLPYTFSVVGSESSVPSSSSTGVTVNVNDVGRPHPALTGTGAVSVPEEYQGSFSVDVTDDCPGWSWSLGAPTSGSGVATAGHQLAVGSINLSGQVICADQTFPVTLSLTDTDAAHTIVPVTLSFTVVNNPANDHPDVATASVSGPNASPTVVYEDDPLTFTATPSIPCPSGSVAYTWQGGDFESRPAGQTAGTASDSAGCGVRALAPFQVSVSNSIGASAYAAASPTPPNVLPAPGPPVLAAPSPLSVDEGTDTPLQLTVSPAAGAPTTCAHPVDVDLLAQGSAPAIVKNGLATFGVAAPQVCADATYAYDVVATDTVNGQQTTSPPLSLTVHSVGSHVWADIQGPDRVILSTTAPQTTVTLSGAGGSSCPTSLGYLWSVDGLPAGATTSALDGMELAITLPQSTYGQLIGVPVTVHLTTTSLEGQSGETSSSLGFSLNEAVALDHLLDHAALAPGEVATLHTQVAPTVATRLTGVLVCDALAGLEVIGPPTIQNATGTVDATHCPASAGATSWGVVLSQVSSGAPVEIDVPVRLSFDAPGGASTAQAFDDRSGAVMSAAMVARLPEARAPGFGCGGPTGGLWALIGLVLAYMKAMRRVVARTRRTSSSSPMSRMA